MSVGISIGQAYAPNFVSRESKVGDRVSVLELVLEDGGVAGGRGTREESVGASSVTAGDGASCESNVAICVMLFAQDLSSAQMDLQESSRASLLDGDVIAITTICAE